MASTDLKTFLENRLTVLDPSIDLSAGSPAQVQFIEPVIAYLGTDPLETDIKEFILDRFTQEYPDIFAGDPGVVSDTFIKPLILMLEPFKREIQAIKKNQSLKDPSVLSDEDADALVANVFDERAAGSLASGVARLYFSNPSNVQIEVTATLYTADGLNFVPTVPSSITAEEMVFNKSGGLFFMDITVQAEQEGDEYNIPKNSLTGMQGIRGAVKVSNLRDFSDGATKLDTPSFVAQARGSLTERSMVTRRGGTAILQQNFAGSVRAIQIIGAGDAEMQRDILSAVGPGHAFLTGKVGLYQQMAYVRVRTQDSGSSITPTIYVGDQVYVYLNPIEPAYAGVSQVNRFVRFTIAEVFLGPLTHPTDPEFHLSYLVRFTETPPAVMTADVAFGHFYEGGISKKGVVTVSSLPGVTLASPVVAESQVVHMLGHTDVYVRPVLQNVSKVVIANLSADPGLVNLQRTTLSSYSSNKVVDAGSPSIDFEAAGVVPGNFLVIESGGDVGAYVIRLVMGSTLYLGSNLIATESNVRYRIISDLTINPFAPRVLKLPFGSLPNNDLQTVIGSNIFIFTGATADLLNYGVMVGDVIEVFGSVVGNGTYSITGFVDGQHVVVDRVAASSEVGLTYEVYTSLEKVELPLVRIKELMVLDSAKQITGVTIPPAEPVAIVPAGNITSAQVRDSSERLSGFVVPDLTQFMFPLPLSPAVSHDSSPQGRYSAGFLKALGVHGSLVFANGTKDEFDYLPEMFGQCSYFVATAEDVTKTENFPPINPKAGDALTLKSGPNKGDYLIKDVIRFRYTKTGVGEYVWAYVIQIYGTFPVDVLAELTAFINHASGPGTVPVFNYTTTDLAVPSYLQTVYSNLGTKLYNALLIYGVTAPSVVELQAAIDSMVLVSYEWGDPARGILRSFFSHPTLFQQHTAESLNPTMYSFETTDGDILKFRPNPNSYDKQELVPPRLEGDASPLDYPRDGEELYLLVYSGKTAPFTVGTVVTGTSSGKTGTIIADVTYGSIGTGTLVVNNATGTFTPSEPITDSGGGAASAAIQYSAMRFSSTSRASAFNLGICAGDVVGIREEFFLHGSTGTAWSSGYSNGKNYESAVQTTYNSTQVTFANSDTPFISDMVGGLFFVEEGVDTGSYTVVKVLDSKNIILDRPLTESTPQVLAYGKIDTWGYNAGLNQDQIKSTTALFSVSHVNKYITIYGMDTKYQGSYRISSLIDGFSVVVDRAGFGVLHFPDISIPFAGCNDGFWIISDAPSAVPVKTGSPTCGTELLAVRPIRIYRHVETEYSIVSVLTSTTESVVGFSTAQSLTFSVDSPFRIFRRDIRRVTPYEMSLKTLGGLFYFDTEVVSLGPNSVNNLPTQSYLTADTGSYESEGYRHIVDDFTLSYSTRETGKLFIPSVILPVNSPDSAENFISLVGSPIQVAYEKGDLVQSVQDFVTSPEDRVTTANMLVRHFLPAYVYYDAEYIGGSAPGVIAKDIISFIDNLAIEVPIDVSEVQKLIENRGGNLETPTIVFTLIHDWDRRQWLEFSQNRIGGTTTLVPYHGTPRVSFFIPGPDLSGQDPMPEGERVNLTQI